MGVPTIYQMLADHPGFDEADLSTVRDAIVGGSSLAMPLLHRYRARGIALRQGFGMTEVGPNCFSLPAEQVDAKAGTVGLPIPHVAARVVRSDGTECDVDEPGELLLAGPAVCGGYWNDPDATAKAVRDGWFHTGDVLSRDADGYFRVRGRQKDMYKSGGENVYPPEVEAVIAECPGVGQIAVLGVPDARWGEVGMAFVEPAPGATLEPDALRAFLEGRLARFKQPKHVRVLPALPRTASGKIDRPALRTLTETPE
jgi:fatty-acyl-CoA synthase